jgi:hypothetical protein
VTTAPTSPTDTAAAPTMTAIRRIKFFIVPHPWCSSGPTDGPPQIVCRQGRESREPADASQRCIAKTCSSLTVDPTPRGASPTVGIKVGQSCRNLVARSRLHLMVRSSGPISKHFLTILSGPGKE